MPIKRVNISPMQFTEAIVDEQGRPTPYFLKQWAFQRSSNLGMDEIIVEIKAVNDAITAVQAINLIAGVGLDGGGDLSGEDRTFDLADTTVVPGTFGSATRSAKITVDQQGRLTAVVEVAIAGGGGAGGDSFAWPVEMDNVFSGSGAATKGVFIEPLIDIIVKGVAVYFASTAGHTYRAGVYRIDGSNNIDELTGVSADTLSPGTFAGGTSLFLPLTADAVMVAGSRYVVVVGRVDGTDTFVFPLGTEVITANQTPYPNLPVKINVPAVTNVGGLVTIAKAQPVIGTPAAPFTSPNTFAIGMKFSV